ncbi:MAG TPA: ABC transporter [Clostridiales bacterium]|nr:ABC transporter [Clostridiales bacterium]
MVKKIIGCLREYRAATIATIVLTAAETLLEIVVPFLQASIIDNGIYGGNRDALISVAWLMIGCIAAALVFGLIASKTASVAASGLAQNMRRDMYFNIQDFSFANIDKFSTAGLVTRLTTDVINIQNAFMMVIRVAVRGPFMIVFALVMAFTINVRIASIYLLLVPILGIALAALILVSRKYFEKVFEQYDKLNQVVQENLSGIRVVKSFAREEYEKAKFQKTSAALYKIFKKAEGIMAYSSPVMQIVVYTCLLLIYWLGASMIVNSRNTILTTGELSSLIAYAMQILTALMMLSIVLILITIARSSARRICEVLDEKSSLTEKENAVDTVKNGEIIFDGVSFNYFRDRNGECIHQVDLKIPSGATVGIIGATGSGKSSLVQLIPRLYDATTGKVTVGGIDVRDYKLDAIRNAVSMVLQKNLLFSGTIKENLRWGDESATDEELVRACRLAQADEFIRQLPDGYDTYIEQGGTNVSGGQKQRLCIARALLKKPKILILDDSTSAVDTKTDALIRKAFREEIPDTTKIIIAQRITSVQDADFTVVLKEGAIDGMGDHEFLLKNNEIYRDIYLSQQGGNANE